MELTAMAHGGDYRTTAETTGDLDDDADHEREGKRVGGVACSPRRRRGGRRGRRRLEVAGIDDEGRSV